MVSRYGKYEVRYVDVKHNIGIVREQRIVVGDGVEVHPTGGAAYASAEVYVNGRVVAIELTTADAIRVAESIVAGAVRPSRLRCLRCGHEWIPRSEARPGNCPKCNSPYWDKPRKS